MRRVRTRSRPGLRANNRAGRALAPLQPCRSGTTAPHVLMRRSGGTPHRRHARLPPTTSLRRKRHAPSSEDPCGCRRSCLRRLARRGPGRLPAAAAQGQPGRRQHRHARALAPRRVRAQHGRHRRRDAGQGQGHARHPAQEPRRQHGRPRADRHEGGARHRGVGRHRAQQRGGRHQSRGGGVDAPHVRRPRPGRVAAVLRLRQAHQDAGRQGQVRHPGGAQRRRHPADGRGAEDRGAREPAARHRPHSRARKSSRSPRRPARWA